MKKFILSATLSAILLVILLGSCGKSGNLYLPTEKQEQNSAN